MDEIRGMIIVSAVYLGWVAFLLLIGHAFKKRRFK